MRALPADGKEERFLAPACGQTGKKHARNGGVVFGRQKSPILGFVMKRDPLKGRRPAPEGGGYKIKERQGKARKGKRQGPHAKAACWGRAAADRAVEHGQECLCRWHHGLCYWRWVQELGRAGSGEC